MKTLLRISLLMSASIGLMHADSDDYAHFRSQNVKTTFIPISQGSNLYTQYHKPIYSEADECWNLDFNVTYRYQRTHDAENIAAHLFQNNPLHFQGSEVENRSENALVADYFGLAPDTDATLRLDPRIQNNIIDFQLALSLDGIREGLWFQANLPLVGTDWDMFRSNDSSANRESGDIGSQNLDIETTAIIGNLNGFGGAAPAGFTINYLAGNEQIRFDQVNTNVATELSQNVSSGNLVVIPGMESTNNYMFKSGFSNKKEDTSATETSPELKSVVGAGYMSPVSIEGLFTSNIAQPDARPASTTSASSTVLEKTEITNAQFLTTKAASNRAIITRNEVSGASSISEALQGGYTFGEFQQRKYNIIGSGTSADGLTKDDNKFGLADIHLQLGYDAWKEECYHFGLYAKAIIPTGTKIDKEHAAFTFSPVVGNGGHFELGAGITGHAEIWCCDDSSLNIYMDGYATHMFEKTQFRTFDLTDKPMSRYALVKSLQTAGTVGEPGNPSDSQDYAYDGKLHAAGDLNAGEVEVYSSLRGEFMLDLVYTCCNWEFGLGYAFSGQTKEKVDENSFNAGQSSQLYGLKGNTFLSDIKLALSGELITGAANPLSEYVGGILYRANGEVAPDATAYDVGNAIRATEEDLLDLPERDKINNRTNRSGLMNGQALHKVFGHLDYTWSESCWIPTFGILGSVGFTGSTHLTAQYWDIGARFGFNY